MMSYNDLNLNSTDYFLNKSITSYGHSDTIDSSIANNFMFNRLNFNESTFKFEDSRKKIFSISKIYKRRKFVKNVSVNEKYHSRRKDNILRKIKVHFFKFIINLCNDFIKHENKDARMKIRNITTELSTDVTVELNLLLTFLIIRILNYDKIKSFYQNKKNFYKFRKKYF